MKLRISAQDIKQLTVEQELSLNEMWIPEKYDIAIANVCVDAVTEEFKQVEFVIGEVEIYDKENIILHDLQFMHNEFYLPAEDAASASYDLEDDSESFAISHPVLPTSYNKKDCIPLLTIGQLIEMLQRRNFGKGDFYIAASSLEKVCELGKQDPLWHRYDIQGDSSELCDVLWEALKEALL